MQVSFNSSATGMSNISTASKEVASTSANQIEQEIAVIDKKLSQLSSTNDNMNHETEISQLTKQRETLQKQLDGLKNSSTSGTSSTQNTTQAQNANEKQPQTKEEADSMKAFGRAYDTTISPQSYTAMQTEQKNTKQTSEQQLLKKLTL